MQVFEKNSNIFRLLSEAISEGILVIDENQTIMATNKAASEMFGFEEEELRGKPLNDLVPDKYHRAHTRQVKDFITNSKKRQMGHGRELYGKRKDGSEFPIEAGLNPFVVYGREYVMALISDITVRKAQRNEILEFNAHLEQKIEKRTRQLKNSIREMEAEVALRRQAENRLKESLKKEQDLNELKTKFLYLVSHEFKTPLTGMLSSASLIEHYKLTEEQGKRGKHINIIKNKIKYLDNILNDFLSMERLSEGKVSYKYNEFPLSRVINEVVYEANMLLKPGQKIAYPEHIDGYLLNFDEKILELTLTNLISNAIKYSPENTEIRIRVCQNKKIISITIIDEGFGIPEGEQQFIFRRYFRAENVLTSQGTGVGLNIVKSHLENLGASISFKSMLGTGSTFTINIPIAPK